MRVRVRLTFWKYETEKGYKGHWHTNYYVTDVINVENGELIANTYIFRNSTLFKGKKFKEGNIGEVTLTIENLGTEELKLLRPTNLVKIQD